MKHLLTIAALLVLPGFVCAQPKPVKVFILAGQSNMEGKAKVALAEFQAKEPATRDLYKHLWKDGKWIERKDVWIKYFAVKGNLTVGYGSPKSIGPELGFGMVVGDRYDEQVLLIKTAWGGRSLQRDFRSPSAGFPGDKVLEKLLVDMKKKTPTATLDDVKKPFGASYRAMFEEVNGTLANLETHFPDYAGQGYEIAGFIWFQGWNDMINAEHTAEYTSNLGHFIRDVRKDLKAPKLPFVIGEMGVDGVKPGAGVVRFKSAQAAVMDAPEFKGNVALVKTDVFWDTEAAAVFKKGWRENLAEWNKVGSDFPYHYLGSPRTMLRIGHAFGDAVLELRSDKKADEPEKKLKGLIKCNGADSIYIITEAIAHNFKKLHQDVTFNIGITGTGNGFRKFANDELDIQHASRKITPAEADACKKNGIEFLELQVAWESLAVVINKNNKFAGKLTMEQLKKIWHPSTDAFKNATTWKDVDPKFPKEKLEIWQPGKGFDVFVLLCLAVNGKESLIRDDEYSNSTMDEFVTVTGVTRNVHAIGSLGVAAYMENKARFAVVAIAKKDGDPYYEPSDENVQSGKYPISRPLFIYINRASLARPEVREFADFYLRRTDLVAVAGHVRLSAEQTMRVRKTFGHAVLELRGEKKAGGK